MDADHILNLHIVDCHQGAFVSALGIGLTLGALIGLGKFSGCCLAGSLFLKSLLTQPSLITIAEIKTKGFNLVSDQRQSNWPPCSPFRKALGL